MSRRITALLLVSFLAVLIFLPASAPAESIGKIIRVGWYDTPFNQKDAFGRRTGYAYEYQRKIAAYTGWKYEYVEGSWPELLQMLKYGRIDLMSDVSYMEERTEYMLYSSIPMGSELYFLYIDPDNRSISADDYKTLNGKTVGITMDSVQKGLFLEWAEDRGLTVNLVELSGSEAESLSLLKHGKIDAFVTLDTYGDPEIAIPLWKIGSSDFFFTVSKNRPDLLTELESALNRIQDENKHYSEQLNAKYLQNSGTNLYLTAEERDWLNTHGAIRVGYQDNYLAFCASDSSGQLTGALNDYLDYASSTLENASPAFEAVAYPTASAAMAALKNGEVDCMFPANLTDYDGEVAGIVMSPPLMRTEMDAVIRMEDKQDFLRKAKIRVGVNQGNPNYEMFLLDHFPSWTPVFYTDTPACLDAVAAKNADCIIISRFRYGDIARQCEKLHLTTVYTGVDMDYCFAVREGNGTLYSILSKMIGQVPESSVNAALTYYSTENINLSFWDEVLDRLPVILGVLCAVLLIALVLVLFRLRTLKRSGESSSRT